MESVLALDIGTSSIRGTLFAANGEQLVTASYGYSPVFLPDGRVRQSPRTWKEGLFHVLSRCGEFAAAEGLTPAAISVTSQRASVIPMDKEGHPSGDAIMWQDKTTHAECARITENISPEEVYAITGLRIDPYFSAPKILWLAEHEPEVFRSAGKFIGVQDYVVRLLTGRYVTDHSQACRTLLMDIRTGRWSPRMLEACALGEDMFPELVPPGAVAGNLLDTIAGLTGFPSGVPVLLAGGDQQVAAVGMGVVEPGTVEANTGTGSFMISPVGKPLFHPDMKTLCSAAAVPGQWVVEAGVLTTGILYTWFAREFAPPESGESSDSSDFSTINRLVESSPPGAHGVITLPHFKGSAAPYWNPYAKGVFFNLSLANTRADMARSVLEAVVLEMGANLNLIREIVPYSVDEVVSAGGLTKFPLFNQLQADIFNCPLRLPSTSEASSLGALICSLVALGVHSDFRDAFAAVQQKNETRLHPDTRNVELYKQAAFLREQLYTALNRSGVYTAADRYSGRLEEN